MTITKPNPASQVPKPKMSEGQYLQQFGVERLKALTDEALDAATVGAVAATARSNKAREEAYQVMSQDVV